MVRAKYWEFLTKSYLTKIFKSSATSWYIVSQNEASFPASNYILTLNGPIPDKVKKLS